MFNAYPSLVVLYPFGMWRVRRTRFGVVVAVVALVGSVVVLNVAPPLYVVVWL